MKSKEFLSMGVFFLLVAFIFFYKIFLGFIPFPGDLLISHYEPWKSSSYLGYNPGSYPSKDQYFDTIRQIYPWKTISIEQIKDGKASLWNPYNFAGSPLLANFQSAVFYPLNIFFFLLPQIIAWVVLIILQPFLASIFTYLFARRLGIGKKGSILSGIAYGYSLFISTFLGYNTIDQTVLWLPLLLLSEEAIVKSLKDHARIITWWFFLFIFTLSFTIFAGHLQLAVLVYGVCALYFMARVGFSPRLVFPGFPLFLLPLAVSAVQLLPTIELIEQSARVSHNFDFLTTKLLLQGKDLVRFFIPDFFGNPATRSYLLADPYPGKSVYIGLVPLFFAFLAIFSFRKNFQTTFFTTLALAVILLITNSPFTHFLYQQNLPFFSTSSPANAIFILSFSLSILAGFGFEDWLKSPRQRKNLAISLLAILIFLAIGFAAAKLPQTTQRNFLYSSIMLTLLLITVGIKYFSENKKIFSVLPLFLIILTIFDLFYFFQKFNPFVPKDLIFPRTKIFTWLSENGGINRFWGYGQANIEANFATQFKLFSPEGYDPLYPRFFGEFIQSSQDGIIHTEFTSQNRSDALIARGFGQTDLAQNPYRLRVLDLLGVKYILDRVENGSTQETFPPNRYNLIYESEGWRIFENKFAAPRIFLTQDFKVFKTRQDFEEIFFAPDFEVSKTILLVEKPSLEGWQAGEGKKNEVRVYSYNPGDINLSVKSDTGGLLFLSDTYFPGWEVFLDGRQTKIYQADYAFRAITVPAGEHKVVFVYQPQSFSSGGKMSIIAVVATLILVLFSSKLLKRKNETT